MRLGIQVQDNTRDVRNRFFYFGFGFEKNSYLIWNEFGLVLKKRFGVDIIVIYHLCKG